MNYHCDLSLTLRCKDGIANYTREVTLPFVPFPGLHILLDDEENDYFEVGWMEWDVFHERFMLCEDRPIGDDGCGCGPEDGCCVLATYAPRTQDGWTLESMCPWCADDPLTPPWAFVK